MKLNKNYYLHNIVQIFKERNFEGWGRKRTGNFAIFSKKIFNGEIKLLEDGFIKSSISGKSKHIFSFVEDKKGIYYDATKESDLENILNTYDFSQDELLLRQSKEAISLIKEFNISKYNHSSDIKKDYFKSNEKKILVIAQTFDDKSLKYGLTEEFSTNEIINTAIIENPDCTIYIKIHPDVILKNRKSDININNIDKRCKIISEDINSISLLKHFDKVYTKTSQMGFEAVLLGSTCVCFGMPFYAGWGITDDRVKCLRRKKKLTKEEVFAASYILYTKYYNPYTKSQSDIIDTIKSIVRFKELENKIDQKIFLFGFSRWKHNFVKAFLKEYKEENIIYINPVKSTHLELALKKGLDKTSGIFIWGKKDFSEIETFAIKNNIKITRVEDGFIRSVGLGSDLTRPYSLVIDKEGIYFDPTTSSSLETLLNTYDFKADTKLIEESIILRKKILESKISKYNTSNHKNLDLPKDKIKILVSGQVEDDASIKFAADNMTNLELLKQVKKSNDDAYIIYKPHPDVLSGNRIGNVEEKVALEYCDVVISDISMSSILISIDEVHTMTSLTGFEGLLYGKKVVTYGLPFYAGWGLTFDKRKCDRRNRNLTLDELCAAVLILYPRYIDPRTLEYCSPIVLLNELEKEKEKINNSIIYKLKIKIFTYISRSSQKIISLVK